MQEMRKRFIGHIVAALATLLIGLVAVFALVACDTLPLAPFGANAQQANAPDWFDPAAVPEYTGEPSVQVNDNVPMFAESDRRRGAFEEYSPLDKLGRCGVAFARIGEETMPTEPRGAIGNIRPSGWQLDKYSWVDQRYLYNRCHLIGWQLAGENDNELNLITGTRSLNTLGMLPYENEIASYVKGTGNHVLYRVTPIFTGKNLVASGVLMEAESVEDRGAGVQFCVWCYNVEPGVRIDYATGKSEPDGTRTDEPDTASSTTANGGSATSDASRASAPAVQAANDIPEELRADEASATYVLNANSRKFHKPECPSVRDMSEHNKLYFAGTRDQAVELGYDPCGYCQP